MKKVVLALTALAAFTGSASAADLARPLRQGSGADGSRAELDRLLHLRRRRRRIVGVRSTRPDRPAGALPLSIDQRQGGSGWFGTVGLGYDWQFNSGWVAGIFADGQFGSLRGTLQDPTGWAGPAL